jgi:hypothetical protein
VTSPHEHPAPETPAPEGTAREVFRTALRTTIWLLIALAVLGVGIGYAVARGPGVWGALIGVGLALVFSGTTIVSMLRTEGATPTKMAAIIMGAWIAKIVLLFVVLTVLRDLSFYSRPVLGAVLTIGVVGSALLDYRAVRGGRVPYITTAPDEAQHA